MTSVAPRNGNDVSYVTRSSVRIILCGRRNIWCMTSVAPRIGNDV